jgi:hypothetical protein
MSTRGIDDGGDAETTSPHRERGSPAEIARGAIGMNRLDQTLLTLQLNCHHASTSMDERGPKTRWLILWRAFCRLYSDSVSCLNAFSFFPCVIMTTAMMELGHACLMMMIMMSMFSFSLFLRRPVSFFTTLPVRIMVMKSRVHVDCGIYIQPHTHAYIHSLACS